MGPVETADEMGHALQLEPIEDLLPALLAGNDASLAKDVEVPRGGGPPEPDCVHEVADAALAVHQRPDESEPSRAAERLEDLVGGCIDRLAGHAISISPNGEIRISSFRGFQRLYARAARRPTEAVATIVYAARSLAHLEQAFKLVRKENPEAAVATADAICSAVENLGAHPLLGRRVHDDIRELVISYGAMGYIALYRFRVPQDEVRLLAIRHQREIAFVP
jgi:plasmid stabilization system protein ParE